MSLRFSSSLKYSYSDVDDDLSFAQHFDNLQDFDDGIQTCLFRRFYLNKNGKEYVFDYSIDPFLLDDYDSNTFPRNVLSSLALEKDFNENIKYRKNNSYCDNLVLIYNT